MEEYYKIMTDILEVEYRIKAIIYVMDELESHYSEEDAFREKYLLAVMKGGISSVWNNTKEIISYIDLLTAEHNKQK